MAKLVNKVEENVGKLQLERESSPVPFNQIFVVQLFHQASLLQPPLSLKKTYNYHGTSCNPGDSISIFPTDRLFSYQLEYSGNHI